MGMYGSYFFVVLRLLTGVCWFGIQTYSGGNLIATCLLCMFGQSWRDFSNSLPLSASVTSKQLLCFFIAWIIQVPLFFIHPTKIQWFFTVKGILMPITTFALFGWCVSQGAGFSHVDSSKLVSTSAQLPLGWSIMAGINTILGSLASLVVSQPDLARYAHKPSDAGWPQGLAMFACKVLVFFLGLASTASIQAAWGKAYWNVWDLLNAILDHHWNAGARCAIFLVSLMFYFSAVGTNIGTNTIAFGADLTGLMPRYMTIRRGQVLCAVLGVAIVPWKILASAQNFVSFLGAVPIFFAPLSAIMVVDYCYARRGNLHVPSLFVGEPGALYWFTYATNWRGIFAWCCGAVMGLPGMVGVFAPSLVSLAAKNMYRLGWLLTFTTAAVVYAACVTFFPVQVYPERYAGEPRTFEYMAKNDGYFPGEEPEGIITAAAITDVEKDLDPDQDDKKSIDKVDVTPA
ncbi:hypothetical protein DL546_006179 [Coniochaeta pulveracea]|nr:hypothetical protein DL546_006179 [Coniochaeta pulveracea]